MDEQKDHFLLALETTRASGIVIDKKKKQGNWAWDRESITTPSVGSAEQGKRTIGWSTDQKTACFGSSNELQNEWHR